ncbi:MAG: DUF7660 family protein [Puniceicoccales bacterium]
MVELDSIYTRDDLIVFIKYLECQIIRSECGWENPTLDRYLEAMSAWINDMEGLYNNLNIKLEDEPVWRTFARILHAATIYE